MIAASKPADRILHVLVDPDDQAAACGVTAPLGWLTVEGDPVEVLRGGFACLPCLREATIAADS